MHPKIFDEQPAGIDVADHTGADRAVVWSRGLVAHENPEIGIGRVAQKRRVVFAQPFTEHVLIVRGRLVLETEAMPGRQFHRDPHGAREAPSMLSSGAAFVSHRQRREGMDRDSELAIVRRAYAKHVMA